jgi:hypothetical protein
MSSEPTRAPHEFMQFFAYEHLQPHLQEVSRPFCDVAKAIDSLEPGKLAGPAASLIGNLMSDWERNPLRNSQATWASVKLGEARELVRHGFACKSAVLMRLLEAKDCAVRALLFKAPSP